MSHSKLRSDKNCLNCGHIVEESYCPHCGQKNTESKKPFHYLITQFIEDFTHYDGHFWGTMKNLLLKPGKLTEIYLAGKRQQFVPPIKLYIFISFITFFLFALFPPFNIQFKFDKNDKAWIESQMFSNENRESAKMLIDSIKAQTNLKLEDSLALQKVSDLINESAAGKTFDPIFDLNSKIDDNSSILGFKTRESYDSAFSKRSSVMDYVRTPIVHKFFELKEKGVSKSAIIQNLADVFFHNLPKALFIYLPIFAFFLWLFHDKKKWWYFEHGVFTLHYFSFLLLNILLFSLFYKINDLIQIKFLNVILYLLLTALTIYSILYFFIAHRRVYHSRGMVSFLKGSVLFTLNFIAFLLLVIGLGIVSFLMVH